MANSELINTLQKANRDYLFTKGMSTINISQPIALNDILFRKSERLACYAPPENLPFELCDKVDFFDCYAYKKGYTALGVILMELLLSNLSYIEVKILNNQSEIKQLFVYVDRQKEQTPFLKIDQKETYKSFKYVPSKINKYPLSHLFGSNHLPTFRYSCSNYQDIHAKDIIEKADQLILSTSINELVLVAELFLNIGRIENTQSEICLENPLYGGAGGVSQTSIEARFWLPNSFAFYTERIDELEF